MFFGTTIATCIIVLKKNKMDNNILFVDASDEFVRGANKNKLSDENIDNILEIIKNRENTEHKSILVPYDDIKKNGYNIAVNTYLKIEDDKEKINIKEVNANIEKIVKREEVLRIEINKIIARLEEEFDE